MRRITKKQAETLQAVADGLVFVSHTPSGPRFVGPVSHVRIQNASDRRWIGWGAVKSWSERSKCFLTDAGEDVLNTYEAGR